MRSKRTIGLTLAVSLAAGCTLFEKRSKSPADPLANATVERVVAKINENSRKVESIRCLKVDVSGKGEGQPFSLNAMMAYQTPNRFRMVGQFAGKSEVDLGSSEEEIWFWFARGKPPAVFFCNRMDLPRLRAAMPFQPDWIIEALGVSLLDPRDYREEHNTSAHYTMVATQKTPTGQTILKRVIVDPSTSRLRGFELYTTEKKLLARSTILEYHDDPAAGAYMPRKIRVEWPEADTKLTLSLNPKSIEMNRITPDYAATLFKRGEYLNTEVVDLAKIDGGGQRQAESRYSRNDSRAYESTSKLEADPRPRYGAALSGELQPLSP